MEKRFRALRLVAVFYKILAWIVLVGGILLTLVTVVFGTLQSRLSFTPGMGVVPWIGPVQGFLSGVILGLIVAIVAIVQFILLYAAAEVIDLGLSIEHNTRETAYYLRGENTIPPPPPSVNY